MIRRHLMNKRGATMITVAVAIVAILAFAVIAIDIAIIFLAKTQLQNAADAAALAGALAYSLSDGDHDAATAEAINVAGANLAIQDQQRPVVITPADVSFPEGNKITVVTHRTAATLDPVVLYFLRVVDPASDNRGNVSARASAAVFPVSGTDCIKPWCFPDQWEDVNNDSIFDDTIDFYDPQITGYKVPDDVGRQVTLKLSNSNNVSPRMGWYYAVDFAPINTGDPVHTGADAYREWIAGCEPYSVSVGDQLQIEPGNMVGPTAQGMAALIDLDPDAEWDPVTGDVINSDYPLSPRVIKAVCFDPTLGVQTDANGRDYLTIVKLLVLFLEEHGGKGEVVGRFIRRATDGEICMECDDGFLFRTALVE